MLRKTKTFQAKPITRSHIAGQTLNRACAGHGETSGWSFEQATQDCRWSWVMTYAAVYHSSQVNWPKPFCLVTRKIRNQHTQEHPTRISWGIAITYMVQPSFSYVGCVLTFIGRFTWQCACCFELRCHLSCHLRHEANLLFSRNPFMLVGGRGSGLE